MKSLTFSPLLDQIRPLLAEQPQVVYLVGGAVRDAVLGRTSHDLDFAVADGAVKLTYKVANSLGVPAYVMDKERDVGRVVLPQARTTLDFARFRSRRGEGSVTIEADLQDRDFTINAIALPIVEGQETADLIDPTGGQADMVAGLVRQVHERSLVDDPVRALRAVRMAVSLGFEITAETEKSIADSTGHFHKVSIERVRDELLKLLLTHSPDNVVRELERLALLPTILSEIAWLKGVEQSAPHYEDVFDHTCSVLGWLTLLEDAILDGKGAENEVVSEIAVGLAPFIPRLRAHFSRPVTGDLDGRTLLRLGALFHDCGKPATQTFEEDGRIRFIRHDKVGAKLAAERLREMHFSNEAVQHVKHIVAHHMRPLLLEREPKLSRRAVFRFFKAAGLAGVDVAFLSLADSLATLNGRDEDGRLSRLLVVVIELYSHYFERFEETVKPPTLLDGNQLMKELGLAPGRQVGRLLDMIQEAQAAGEISTREQAVEFARQNI